MLTYFDEDEIPAADRTTLPGVPFIDAGPNHCRWPLWEADTDPRHVCGARKRPGSSYCREHAQSAGIGQPMRLTICDDFDWPANDSEQLVTP